MLSLPSIFQIAKRPFASVVLSLLTVFMILPTQAAMNPQETVVKIGQSQLTVGKLASFMSKKMFGDVTIEKISFFNNLLSNVTMSAVGGALSPGKMTYARGIEYTISIKDTVATYTYTGSVTLLIQEEDMSIALFDATVETTPEVKYVDLYGDLRPLLSNP